MLRKRSIGRSVARRLLTLLGAYVVIAQAALAGLATGAHAGPAVLDPFGQILCATADRSAPDAPAPHLPKCCAPGCTMSGPNGAPPAAAAAAAPVSIGDVPAVSALRPGAGQSPEGRPNAARAPPQGA